MSSNRTKNNVAFRILPGQNQVLVYAEEELVWKAQHPEISPVYRCAGLGASGKCRAHMVLVPRSQEDSHPYFKKPKTAFPRHLIDCPYNSNGIRKVSQLSLDAEELDLNAALTKLTSVDCISENQEPKPVVVPEEQGNLAQDEEEMISTEEKTRKAQSLFEYYYILKISLPTDRIIDGRTREDVLVDSESFEKYRKGSKELQGPGIVVATGGVKPEIFSHFINPKFPAIVLKDPFFSLSQQNVIHYVLRFRKWEHFKEIKGMKDFVLKMGKIYIILAEWHRINCKSRPDLIIYEAIISSKKQLMVFTQEKNFEDLSRLHEECRKVYEMETQ